MSKVVAIAASLKAVMLIATAALARGDMLPVILISALFDLGLQIRRKAGHTEATRTARDHQVSQKGAVIVERAAGPAPAQAGPSHWATHDPQRFKP